MGRPKRLRNGVATLENHSSISLGMMVGDEEGGQELGQEEVAEKEGTEGG